MPSCLSYIKARSYFQRDIQLGDGPTELGDGASSKDNHAASAEPPAISSDDPDLEASTQGEKGPHRPEFPPVPTSSCATPSDLLIRALRAKGLRYVKPERFSTKLDLSYHAPISAGTYGRKNVRRRVNRKLAMLDPKNFLQLTLSRYIQYVHPLLTSRVKNAHLPSRNVELDAALLKVFNRASVKALQAKRLDVSDLMSWTWILTAETSKKAATRLMILANSQKEATDAVIPTFVFLLLLRRTDMAAPALRLLVIHAWDRLEGQPRIGRVTSSEDRLELAANNIWLRKMKDKMAIRVVAYQPMSETTVMTMVVRLLRHCRKLWPAACVTITAMLTRYINGIAGNNPTPEIVLSNRTFSRLTFLYNRALSLLSLPSSTNPFQSVAHQQRAQFAVLRRMNEFEPALAIDREGYRAVTRVQLAHKKTLREREWADMKAKSWPPWKEEKLGMDVDKGPEYGISRAGESMGRSKEAGYAPQEWESSAAILAGWDTDRSPTIQTRTRFQKPLLPRRVMISGTFVPRDEDDDVWASRIRATRTLDEAWVCFLAYKDRKGNPSQAPYYAMLEKLYFDGQRGKKSNASGSVPHASDGPLQSLPGDGKEVLPNPEDPRVSIYVRTPPLSIEEFLDRMIEDRIHPSGRFLAFLLNHAESFPAGKKCLLASSLRPRIKRVLLDQDLDEDPMTRAELESVPEYIFAAFIHFLSRFAPTFAGQSPISVDDFKIPRKYTDYSQLFVRRTSRGTPTNSFLHALRLMACRQPYYRPPWNSLLSALARTRTTSDSHFGFRNQNAQNLLTWYAVCELLHSMHKTGLDLDLQGFHNLCVALEKAIFAGESLIPASDRPMLSPDQQPATNQSIDIQTPGVHTKLKLKAEHVLLQGLPLVKKIFRKIVMSDTKNENHTGSDSDELREWLQDHKTIAPGALLPRLIEVPAPAQLHAFIRVLGLRRDYTGILDVMQWMDHYAPELKAVADEAVNGLRMTRRCIVAMRVFLERCWSDGADGTDGAEGATEGYELDYEGAPDEVIEKVYRIVESNEHWGGWPTDEEVDVYCQKGRFI